MIQIFMRLNGTYYGTAILTVADKYANFWQLSQHETPGWDYRIRVRYGRSGIAILAPHGGRIERGTSPIADALAGQNHTFYSFEGLKPEPKQNRDLHITSDHFDEPLAIAAIAAANRVITIHGAKGGETAVYAGGLDLVLRSQVLAVLGEAGFAAADDPSPTRQGKGTTNICNRGRTGKGLQLELTFALRKRMFLEPDERGLRRPSPVFRKFVSAVRRALNAYTSRARLTRSGTRKPGERSGTQVPWYPLSM